MCYYILLISSKLTLSVAGTIQSYELKPSVCFRTRRERLIFTLMLNIQGSFSVKESILSLSCTPVIEIFELIYKSKKIRNCLIVTHTAVRT